MYERRLFLILLRPSVFSGISVIAVGMVFFSAAGWIYASRSPQFYDYLFGPSGIATTIDHTTGQTHKVLAGIATQSWIYNAVVLGGAIAVGVVVYILLQSFAKMMFTISETLEEVQEGDAAAKRSLEREIILRLALRVIVVVAWAAYIYLCAQILIPLCLALFRDGLAIFPTTGGWLQLGEAAALFFIMLHLHVICIRLLVLRPRVFGGEYVIMSAMEP